MAPDSVTLVLLDHVDLTAVVRDAHGAVLPYSTVTWSSSDSGVASVTSAGRVHAAGRGVATVTATADGMVGEARVVVVAPITYVELTPPADTVRAGDTLRLGTILRAIDGGPPTDSTLTWTSSDTTIATAAPQGLVRGRRAGVATVRATSVLQVQGSARITVRPRVTSVTVTPADTSIFVFDLAPLVTIVRDSAGDTLTQWQDLCLSGCIQIYPVSFQSRDTTVAHFVTCCTLQGRAAGTDTVVATSDGVTGSAVLHVSPLAFTAAAVGNYQACGLLSDSTMRCWASGHPGPGTERRRFTALALSDAGVCGLTGVGRPLCLGDTTFASGAPSSVHVDVGGPFCGLTAAHAAWCAGAGSRGQLGSGTDTVFSQAAVTVVGGHAFEHLSTGADHVCAVDTGGAAYCWGSNGLGMLGIGDTTVDHSATPLAVSGGLSFVDISAGAAHTCGVTTSGDAYCWGFNGHGELGTGDSDPRSAPALVAGGLQFASISAGIYHTCAIAVGGAAYCWGTGGTLGNGPAGSTVPVAVSGGHTFLTISAAHGTNPGGDATCGLTTDGVYCWGFGTTGVTGVTSAPTPVKVEGQ